MILKHFCLILIVSVFCCSSFGQTDSTKHNYIYITVDSSKAYPRHTPISFVWYGEDESTSLRYTTLSSLPINYFFVLEWNSTKPAGVDVDLYPIPITHRKLEYYSGDSIRVNLDSMTMTLINKRRD